jgi:hypothetical protein
MIGLPRYNPSRMSAMGRARAICSVTSSLTSTLVTIVGSPKNDVWAR